MAEVILVASGKGGVGKSTFSSFLGKVLADSGKKVLMIDSDTGLGALDIMLGVDDVVMNSWMDIENGDCEFKDALITVSENLSLIASPKQYPEEISDDVFVKLIKKCGDKFDFVIIDAAAGIDDNFRRAGMACDKAIFIATADEVSVRCAANAASKIEALGMSRDNMRIVVNRFVKKAALKCRLINIDGAIDKSGISLLGILPEDSVITYSTVTRVIPKNKSAFIKAMKRIVKRICGESVPLNLKELK